MRDVAILRFSPTEGPGHLAAWLAAHDLPCRVVALDADDPVPADPRAFAGIAMMGGPMSVNDALPWVAPVCALVEAAVGADVPVIGHCLGGQLLAKALGAEVRPTATPEIGWIDVATDDARAAPEWFGGRAAFETFQWHFDTFALPVAATRVLTNRHNAEQAYVVADRHIGMQCHIEMTTAMVEDWLATGAGELPDASTPSRQSAADIRAGLPARVAALNAVADDVYARWARGLRR
jgi:GMP synthase-like glutamine amidotransferase